MPSTPPSSQPEELSEVSANVCQNNRLHSLLHLHSSHYFFHRQLYAASKLLKTQKSPHPHFCEPFLVLTVIEMPIELIASIVFLIHRNPLAFILNLFIMGKDIVFGLVVLRCHHFLNQKANTPSSTV
uniref:Uncharacterized protein n=1 Tax=Ditylenchus dipsaci TaxID=166011 RepID=A0A915EPY4_9BILA